MRVAVAAEGPEGLDAIVSYTFGRAPYFVLVDVEGDRISGATVHSNPYAQAPSGAGPAAAQFIANLGAEAVIAGDFGPNASAALMGMGILMAPGLAGMRVREAVEAFLEGGARPGLTAPSPYPAAPVPQYVPPSAPPYPAPYQPPSREAEIQYLKERKRWIEERLKEIERRLKELEGEG